MERIEIPLSKTKLLFGIGGSLIFVMLGYLMFSNASTEFESPMLAKGAGIASVIFFGATFIYAIKKIFDKSLGLIIDQSGITDNSNATSIGLISWQDIREITVKQISSTKFMLIHVRDPEMYLDKASSGMQKRLMKANIKMYGTPISITSNTLKYNFADLEKLIIQKHSEFNNQT